MKTKTNKNLIAFGLLVTMFALYAIFPLPSGLKADSITDAADTISDSDIDATGVLHTFTFTTVNAIPAGGKIEIDFDPHTNSDFNAISADGDVTCHGAGSNTGSAGTRVAVCTYAAGLGAGEAVTMTVDNMTNPSDDGSRRLDVTTANASDQVIDRVSLMVYIIQDIHMTATVDPVLEFTVNGVLAADNKVVNNTATCDLDTTSSSTPFGLLTVNATTTICQRLTVETNADDGYIVTVEQDQELTSDSGSNINSFDNSADGTGSSSAALAHAWTAPNNTLDEYNTYGHMGLTSDDVDDLAIDFDNGGVANYVGFTGTNPIIVMSHNGPSDGVTQSIGEAFVAYTAEVASLQEAGDYENTLTYIATPTY